MLLKTTSTALLLISLAEFSHAQESAWYADVGYQYAQAELSTIEADFSNVAGHVGYDFNRNFGVEAEGVLGVGNSNNVDGYNLDLDYSVGAFAKIKAPLSRTVELYGRGGIVSTRFSEDVETADFLFEGEVNREAVAFGVGSNFLISGRNGIRAEYTYYDFDVEDISINANTFYAGYYHRF